MRTTFIYALCEPGTRTVRYIGKSDSPKARLSKHLCYSRASKNHLGRWISSLTRAGARPELVSLREVPFIEWQAAEERYIRLARGCGMNLVNATDGGDGSPNPSPETREKLRRAKSGDRHPMFGRKHPDSTRRAIGDSMRGIKRSPQSVEHRAAISRAKKGTIPTAEHRAKNSAANSGEKNAMFGKPSPNRGRILPPEVRKRMSDAAKVRWAKRGVA